jgi:uncharacterized DUF497 family protein
MQAERVGVYMELRKEPGKLAKARSFNEITGVFSDPYLLEFYDPAHSSLDEERYICKRYICIGCLRNICTLCDYNRHAASNIGSANNAEKGERLL